MKAGCFYRKSSSVEGFVVCLDRVVHLPSQVALRASHDVRFGQSLRGAPVDLSACARAIAHPDDDGQVQGSVGVAVTATV